METLNDTVNATNPLQHRHHQPHDTALPISPAPVLLPKPSLPPPPQTPPPPPPLPPDRLGLQAAAAARAAAAAQRGSQGGKVLPSSGALLGFLRFPACAALLGALAGAFTIFFTFSLMFAPALPALAPAPLRCSAGGAPYDASEDLARGWSYIDDPQVWGAGNGPLIGPAEWGRIQGAPGAPRFPLCNGPAQSPVDLRDSDTVVGAGGQPQQLARLYNTTSFLIGPRDQRPGFEIVPDNINKTDWRVNGAHYHLDECHFHMPSEHTINGKDFAFEAHFVHFAYGKEPVAFAILFDEDTELQRPNSFLRSFFPWMFYPDLLPFDRALNVSAFLDDIEPWALVYDGSLTVPPCVPVKWYVTKSKTPVNLQQLAAFSFRMQQQNSDRPVQPLNGRQVTRYTLNAASISISPL